MSLSTSGASNLEIHRCKFLIVGSGIAGLWTALHLSGYGDVTVITKSQLRETNTQYAQGGIAVAMPAADSPELHRQDTLEAGAGLCEEPAVTVLTEEGPGIVRELIARGAHFDKHNGELMYGREAAHGRNRILHSHGDATGAEVQRTASEAIAQDPAITLREKMAAADLLIHGGECLGVEAVDLSRGSRVRFLADCTLLATGGAGSLYRYTTNPPVATADGPALAFRAGVSLRDMEFVQFHPTALCAEGYPKFLISEAVRGEGAHLLDLQGQRFMPQYHPLAELAPRDVVARAVFTEMQKAGARCMYLDFAPLGAARLAQRFPGIIEELERRGFHPAQEPVPITPAAHYMMGGITADINGFTGLPRLYACGECADYGVHGANRLASNSLLDGLVFGRRSALAMAGTSALTAEQERAAREVPVVRVHALKECAKDEIAQICWDGVGIVRGQDGLAKALRRLESMQQDLRLVPMAKLGELEAANMVQVAWLIARAALAREESRGAHYRTDFPQAQPSWRRHIVIHRDSTGVVISHQPVGTPISGVPAA